jgi:cytoskeletal protein CcmA (bactofilin family)
MCTVHFYVNGQFKGAITADQSRPDIGAAYPAYGANHGFSGQIDAVAASNTVCAYGIDQGAGGNALLGCKVVNVSDINPIGSFDSATGASFGKINVSGWALDPNAGTGSIDVHFYVNGQFKGAITADQSRPDIGAAYPAYGANHGFSGQLDAVATSNTVCAYGINKPGSPGGNVLLGCRAVSVQVNPFGSFDSAYADSANGKLNVSGWAIDPNAGTGSTDVHFYVNGQFKGAITADGSRADLDAIFPYGPNHGFSGQIDNAGTGNNTICAYGINTGAGGNVLLGCRVVNVPTGNPFGSFDGASDASFGKINVSGWAIDPNAGTGSIDVHFYVNGVFKGALTADGSRSDLDAIFPYGPSHGFSGQIDAVATSNTVCAYGINKPGSPGGNVLLGCRAVSVQVNPFGSLDGTSAAVDVYGLSTGKLDVSGWAIDPNAGTGSIDVHFYVNGQFKGAITADVSRADLDALFPYGPNHGFSGQIDVAAYNAVNTVCAYGFNTGAGGNVLLGCRAVSVPPPA